MMATNGMVIGAIIAFFIIVNLWRRLGKAVAPARATPPPRVPAPAAVLPLRRRLAEPAVPVLPPRPPAAQPARRPAPPAAPLSSEFAADAAGAFAGLDLALPDAGVTALTAARRPRRTIGSAAVLGSRGWGAGAIVALEVLGPPVAVRPGATLGASHAL